MTRPRPTFPWLAAVALAYLVLGRLSFAASVSHDIVTTVVFAAEGVSLAAALRLGPWAAAGVFAGQLGLALSTGLPAGPALAVSAVNAAECALVAWAAVRLRLDPGLGRLGDVLKLVGLSALVLQPFSASLGVGALVVFGRVAPGQAGAAWTSWWLGNLLGQLTMAPSLLALSRPGPRWGRAAAVFVGVGAVGAAVFGLVLGRGLPTFGAAFALYFPLLTVVSALLGLEGGAAAVLASSVVAVAATSLGRGPFVSDWAGLDIFLVGATLGCLSVAALFEERRRQEAALLETNRALSQAIQEVRTLRGIVPVCAWCKDIRTLDGEWHRFEEILATQTEASVSHGLCARCEARLAGEHPPP